MPRSSPGSSSARALVVATAAVAVTVLLGWWFDVLAATSWGAGPRATPLAVVTLLTVATAIVAPPPWRRRLTYLTAAMVAATTAAPDVAVAVQQALFPGAVRTPAGGAAVAVLLLAAAVWTWDLDEPDLLPLALAAGSVALVNLSVTGALVGIDWLGSAGSASVTIGMPLPTAAVVVLLAVAVWTHRPPDAPPFGSLERGVPRRHWRVLAGLSGAFIAPLAIVLMHHSTPGTDAQYLLAALLTVAAATGFLTASALSDRRDAHRTLTTMLDAAPDATIFCALDGTIVRVNAQAAALFGWDRDDLEGKPVEALVPTELRDRHRGHRRGFASSSGARDMSRSTDLQGVRRDGTRFVAEVALSPVRLRSRTLIAATIRDASSHHERVEALRRLQAMQTLFLSAVSHELRTPLTVVRGIAETWAGRGGQLEPATQSLLADRLVSNTDRLQTLITDLLDLDRLSRSDGASFGQVDVGASVDEQVRRSAQDLALTPTVEISSALPHVAVDDVLLRRVVDNLLSNASKYAPGPVEVSVSRQGDELVLQVDDHGPGVPPALRRRIFEPFERGAAFDPATPGVGIGLALVLGFARSTSGRAWVQERDDGQPGSSFRVVMPIQPAAGRESVGGPGTDAGLASP